MTEYSRESEILALLKELKTALYSSDFTEPLGQYRTERFYKEISAVIAKAEKNV